MKKTILIIEDSELHQKILQTAMTEAFGDSINCYVAGSLKNAREFLLDKSPSIILLDLNLPNSQGIATIDAVHSMAAAIPIIIVSSVDDRQVRLHSHLAGIEWIAKADEIDKLQDVVIAALSQSRNREIEFARIDTRLNAHASIIRPIAVSVEKLTRAVCGDPANDLDDGIAGQVKGNTAARKRVERILWITLGAAVAAILSAVATRLI